MRRRDFITGIAGSAAAWPLAARAQQAAMPVIGFLNSTSPEAFSHLVVAFRQGLGEIGYVEGQNVAIEYRWADGQYDRLPALAADLVRRQVAVIASIGGTPAALAAKAATTTIPIVFQLGIDPVAVGLVTSLSRPGGNLTGVTSLGAELAPKQLEVLHELIPAATSLALLVNPATPVAATVARSVQAAASTLGLELHVLHASADRDFDAMFTTLARLGAGGLVISTDSFFNSRGEQLGILSAHHRVPAIAQYREFVAAGGLACYGGSATDLWRLAGAYVGRILKGERPADLPVQQSTKAELIINLKTAKAIGVTVPTALLVRADEVTE
jgi:putative tryptophan/tyrosine transport system substrate-binding protein